MGALQVALHTSTIRHPHQQPESVQHCPAVKSVLYILFISSFSVAAQTFSHGLNSVHLILYYCTVYATGSLVLYRFVLYRFVHTP